MKNVTGFTYDSIASMRDRFVYWYNTIGLTHMKKDRIVKVLLYRYTTIIQNVKYNKEKNMFL